MKLHQLAAIVCSKYKNFFSTIPRFFYNYFNQ
jgi:hypothetical protein